MIWSSLLFADAPDFMCDVFGFERQIVVSSADDPAVIEHSQLRWPEGGIVQVSTVGRPGNVFADRPTGVGSLYMVTADPQAVWERCLTAGVEVVQELMEPDHSPGTTVFSVRDTDGNLFSFGSYVGEA